MSKIVYVDPNKVILEEHTNRRDVGNQVKLLNKQGQIVPLVAKETTNGWVVNDSDYPYATAQVEAAIELGWSTIILTDSAEED